MAGIGSDLWWLRGDVRNLQGVEPYLAWRGICLADSPLQRAGGRKVRGPKVQLLVDSLHRWEIPGRLSSPPRTISKSISVNEVAIM